MRIAFKTFGCRANSNDTDALYLEAVKRGFTIVTETDPADAYIINTCTVTENADRDARQQAFRFKRMNQGAFIGLVGCYAQVAKDEILKFPEVDFVVGTANKFKTLDHLEDLLKGKTISRDQVEEAKGFLPEKFSGSKNSRATIKIQDGCNYRCSFCIIPQARGRSRSLAPEIILRQVQDAFENGFQEIVLTGIHLAHYGWDQNSDLLSLVKLLLKEKQGPRIRISSLDPFEIPDGLIDLVGNEKRLCPHFHIALQSGSDKILSSMRRIYKAAEFFESTQKIVSRYSDTFVGVDVIVGFPGEGEAEFQETLQILKNTFWSKLHVFSFSERKGTYAETLPYKNIPSVISERSEILRSLSTKRYVGFLDSQIGKTKEVLLEKPSKKYPSMWLGHTENYLPTYSLAGTHLQKNTLSSILIRREGEKIFTTPK